jgi:hypothetical protein
MKKRLMPMPAGTSPNSINHQEWYRCFPNFRIMPRNRNEIELTRHASRTPSRDSRHDYLEGDAQEWLDKVVLAGYVSSTFLITGFLAVVALITSVCAVIVFLKTRHAPGSLLSNQSIPIFTGTCNSDIRVYTILGNLAINSVGTIILASSNYLQQICSSPSFEHIEKSIKAGKDLKFGRNSPTAVLRQPWPLICLWIFLVLTSVPLHYCLTESWGMLSKTT